MTLDEIRDCEALARSYRRATGNPLYVPQSIFEQLRASGVSLVDVVAVKPVPMHAAPKMARP